MKDLHNRLVSGASNRTAIRKYGRVIVPALLGASSLCAAPAFAADTTMKLIKMMRDNGSITDAQYNQLQAAAAQNQQQPQPAGNPSVNKGRVFNPRASGQQISNRQATNDRPSGHSVNTKLGKTTISGKTYVDGSWINSRHETANGHQKNGNDGYGFDVKRFYLTIDQNFNKMFSARFRTDIETGDSAKHPNVYNVYVKNAYVQAKFSDAFALRAGVADLPWVPYVEGLYGYRYVEHVLIDRAHFGTSADLGLHALGKLADGKIDYQLSLVNGGGYHNVSRGSSVDVSGRIGFHPVKQATFAIGGRVGKLAAQNGSPQSSTANTAYRLDAVAAWVSDVFRIGVDGFYAKNFSSGIVLGNAPKDTAFGGSAWASYTLPVHDNQFSLFGRYDYVKPHSDTNSGQHDNFFTTGVQYHPTKPLKLALLYKFDRISQGNGVIGYTGNGTTPVSTSYNATNIGATAYPNRGASYDEVGIFAQYVF
jgi:hypothetical protein